MQHVLSHYPFADTRVCLVEGFSQYDSVLKDTPGDPHRGIDYVLMKGVDPVPRDIRTIHDLLRKGSVCVPFDVHAMHDGIAYQGVSTSWGNFVLMYLPSIVAGTKYRTVYAHLDDIPVEIPQHDVMRDGKSILNPVRYEMSAGRRIGRAGTSGMTNGIIQLHIELHDVTDLVIVDNSPVAI